MGNFVAIEYESRRKNLGARFRRSAGSSNTELSNVEKRIEGRLTGYETGGEEGENLEDRSTGITRGESLFMHLRDSGFTKVPPASEREVPGESRYRSNSLSLSFSDTDNYLQDL